MAIANLTSRRMFHFPRGVVHVGLRADINRRLGTGRQFDDRYEGAVDVRDNGEERHGGLCVGQ